MKVLYWLLARGHPVGKSRMNFNALDVKYSYVWGHMIVHHDLIEAEIIVGGLVYWDYGIYQQRRLEQSM